MRVALVSTFKARCGIATHTLDLSSALVERGADVFVIAEERSSGVDESQKTSIPYERAFDRTIPESYDKIVTLAKKHDAEVLHVQHETFIFPGTALRRIAHQAKMAGMGFVVTFHSVPYPEQYDRVKPFSPEVDLAISYTPGGQQVLDLAGFRRTAFVPHGVREHPEKSIVGARKMLGIDPDRFVFSSSGFVGTEKGLAESLLVLRRVQEKIPDALYIHAGGLNPAVSNLGVSYMARLKAAMRNLRISPRDFILTGYLSDDLMPVYAQASNIIILNYLPSGVFSASGTFARASVSLYRPIVTVTGTRRIEEAVHGETCWKVPYNNPDKMAEAIVHLHEHPELCERLVERQRRYVQENSWTQIAEKHVKLYNQTVSPEQVEMLQVGTH